MLEIKCLVLSLAYSKCSAVELVSHPEGREEPQEQVGTPARP